MEEILKIKNKEPAYSPPKDMANQFNQYFISIGQELAEKIELNQVNT